MEPIVPTSRPRGIPDEALVARVASGDVAAFETLMRRHNARVYRTVRAVVRDEAEVEDVMQQAYLAAFANLKAFRGDSSFSTWLLRIAHNEAQARRKRALKLVPLDMDAEAEEAAMTESGPRPDAAMQMREITRLTESAIDALPETLRSVFMLRGVQGLDTAEVATVLGLTEEVVKQRLHRAREAMRRHLEQQMDERLDQAFDFLAPRCDRVAGAVLEQLMRRGT